MSTDLKEATPSPTNGKQDKKQIEKWKSKYPGSKIFALSVQHPDTKDFHYAYVRHPEIIDFQRAAASDKKKVGTYTQSIFENCALSCDDTIKNDTRLYMGVLARLDDVIEIAEVEVKEV